MQEGWTTTLPEKFDASEIIALYCDHATHEQFHSEFNTDMERLPSCKFDTNYLAACRTQEFKNPTFFKSA